MPYAPRPDFARRRIKARCLSAIPLLVEDRPSIRPFAHGDENGPYDLPPQPVTAPGLYLRGNSKTFPGPFDFWLSAPLRFFAEQSALTAATRCRFRSQNSPPVFQRPLPVGTSQSLGIAAQRSKPGRQTLLLRVARSSFAPRPAIIFNRRRTDRRSRFATSRQARCP